MAMIVSKLYGWSIGGIERKERGEKRGFRVMTRL